jgi:putative component of toxin-antitoxin plasmid stabilization module
LVLILGAGDKSTQARDIKAARRWQKWKKDNDV